MPGIIHELYMNTYLQCIAIFKPVKNDNFPVLVVRAESSWVLIFALYFQKIVLQYDSVLSLAQNIY